MQQLVAEMAADCNNGQLEQAKNRYESVGVTRSPCPRRPAPRARRRRQGLARQGRARPSTSRPSTCKVQGVVVNREGRSGVLLNGDTYEEGDYVSDDLLVKLVEEEQVWFVFRGLTLVRTM
jgi:hypothetical protein